MGNVTVVDSFKTSYFCMDGNKNKLKVFICYACTCILKNQK